MPNSLKPPHFAMAICAMMIPTVAAFATMPAASQPGESPLCEVKVTPGGNTLRLEALVHADHPLGGTYSFQIEKQGDGGRSTIDQSGEFDARAGHPQLLSSTTLDASGAYNVVLDLMSSDQHFRCTKRIGGD